MLLLLLILLLEQLLELWLSILDLVSILHRVPSPLLHLQQYFYSTIADYTQVSYVLAGIPNLTRTPSLSLIYRASCDGWKTDDFHIRCNNTGPTVTLVRSSRGILCGGYTKVPWSSNYTWVSDPDARLFALTDEKIVYFPQNSSVALKHGSYYGPNFGYEMKLGGSYNDLMNRTYGGYSLINGTYNVTKSAQGNSRLTGDGSGSADGMFTATEIEVYTVIP